MAHYGQKPFVEPISLAEPTALDLKHTRDLEQVRVTAAAAAAASVVAPPPALLPRFACLQPCDSAAVRCVAEYQLRGRVMSRLTPLHPLAASCPVVPCVPPSPNFRSCPTCACAPPPSNPRQHLRDQGLYESQEEAETREMVLGRLDALVKQWILGVAGLKGHPMEDANAKVGAGSCQ